MYFRKYFAKKVILICSLLVAFAINFANAQNVTTNSGSGLSSTYPDLATAITALNAATITDPVVITLTGNETAPATGYYITATGTATNTITIQGSGSIITAGLQTTSGGTMDAVFKLIGSDYVTLQNFNIQENSGNTVTATGATNTMTEAGILLIHASDIDGAQHNTIQNDTISLNGLYPNSVGILSTSASSTDATGANNALLSSASSGTNSFNMFYANVISNVAQGMYFICTPITTTINETGIDVGGSSAATGNNITFGCAAVGTSGIWNLSAINTNLGGVCFRNGAGANVSNNTITSNNVNYLQSGGVNGICYSYSTTPNGTPSGITYTNTFNNNTINITTATIYGFMGIDNGGGSSTTTGCTANFVVTNNNISLTSNTANTATSANFIGVRNDYANNSSVFNNNNVTISINHAPTTGTVVNSATIKGAALGGTSPSVQALNNSVIVNETASPQGTATATLSTQVKGIAADAAITSLNISNNTLRLNRQANAPSGTTVNMNGSSASYYYMIYHGSSTTVYVSNMNVTGNTIKVREDKAGLGNVNWYVSTGYVYHIYTAGKYDTLNINNNNLSNDGNSAVHSYAQYGIYFYAGQYINNVTYNTTNFVRADNTGYTYGYDYHIYLYSSQTLSNNTQYNISYNSLNDSSMTTSATTYTYFYGIYNYDNPPVKNIIGNTINTHGNWYYHYSLYHYGTNCNQYVLNNTLNLNTTYNQSIGTPTIYGLYCASSCNREVAKNNTVKIGSAVNWTTAPSYAGTFYGMYFYYGTNDTIANNNISIQYTNSGTATSTGSPTLYGMYLGSSMAGFPKIYNNKIADLTQPCSGASGVVRGIYISGGIANEDMSIFNNRIGNLSAPKTTNSLAVTGIYNASSTASTTYRLYFNTINIQASSTGATYGDCGVYLTTSTTATTAKTEMMNNIIVDKSTPSGTGICAAIRRSSANALQNYSTGSNNNLIFGSKFFYDGTTSAPSLTAYQSIVAPRDNFSVTDNLIFMGTTGSSPNFLEIANGTTTPAESGAASIGGISTDFDGAIRFGNSGYTGTSVVGQDIGSDEFDGISTNPYFCSGTPGTPAAKAPTGVVCPATAFTLSDTSGNNYGTAITYQWQTSPVGANSWTNVPGGISQNYTFPSGINTAADYRLVVTCLNGGATSTSNTVTVNLTSFLNCYCTSNATTTADEEIWNVTIGSVLNNSSTCTTTGPGPGSIQSEYSNYATLTPTNLYQGITYPCSVWIGYCGTYTYTNIAAIYIDYNQNGSFADAGETVFMSTSAAGASVAAGRLVSGSFVCSANATPGVTKMRVVAIEGSSATPCGTYGYGETEDYLVNIIPLPACSSVLTPVVSGPSNACSNLTTTLTASNYTFAANMLYQWESSAPGANVWTPIAGATSNTLNIVNLTTPTDYHFLTTCTNTSTAVASNTLSLGINPFYMCYCTPASTCTNEGILSVNFNGASNSSGFCTNTTGYSDYRGNGSLTTVTQGQSVAMSVYAQVNSNPASAAVWIDYNHSGTFDASEFTLLGTSNGLSLPTQYYYNNGIYIPQTALTGVTAMRVRQANQGGITATSACTNTGVYGEYEDYLITIAAGTPCSGQPFGGTAFATANNMCSGNAFTLVDTGMTAGINLTLQWQSLNTTTSTWSNISGATAATLNFSAGITATTTYRLAVTCTNSGLTDYSSPVTETVNPFYLCYCGYNTNPQYALNSSALNYLIGVQILGTSLNNSTAGQNAAPNGYSLFYPTTSSSTCHLAPGVTYGLNTTAQYTGYYTSVWIDFDQSGTFDATEFVALTSNSYNGTGTITVPTTAAAGLTGMRVRLYYTQYTSGQACATAYGYEDEDYVVTIDPYTTCSGTPSPSTVSAPSSACAGSTITLYASTFASGSGISYQWQKSPSGANTWANVTGATGIYFSDVISVATDYRLVTTCANGGGQDFSATATVGINPFYTCYCSSSATSTSDEEIWNVTFGALNNSSVCSTVAPGAGSVNQMYSNYTTLTPTTINLNAVIPLSVWIGYCGSGTYSNIAAVYIDWNQNGLYTDAGETVFTSSYGAGTSVSAGRVVTGTVTVPATATLGNTGMRVVAVEGSTVNPCGTYTWGETEDYIVTVAPQLPCSGTPNASVATGPSTICANTSFTMNTTGFTQAMGVTYQWEKYDAASSSWVAISGATNTFYTVSAGITTATDFHMVSTCSNGGVPAVSNTVSVGINPFYVCYCASAGTYTGYGQIFNVTVGALNNTSTCSTVAPGPGSVNQLYSNYTTLAPTTDTAGQYISYSITTGYCTYSYQATTAIYIDFNHNGSFSDVGENVWTSGYNYSGTSTGTFLIPSTSAIGVTGMRIVHNPLYTTVSPCGTQYYGEVEDYLINIAPPPPCSGTPPTPGAKSVTNICPAQAFSLLDTSGNMYLGGTTFQWEYSVPGANTWNSVPGATTANYTFANGQTVSYDYHLVATCTNSGLSSVSNVINVTINAFYNCYCACTNYAGSGSLMDQVTFNTLVNNTASTNPTGFPAYNAYTNTTTVYAGTNVPMSILVNPAGTYSGAIISVWIDFNHDGVYAANEWTQIGVLCPGGQTTTTMVNIPATALPGNTGMRIRSRGNGNQNGAGDACLAMGSGETEDYVINIALGAICTTTPAGGNAYASSANVCPNQTFSITDTGMTVGLGITYQWQSSAQGQNTWSNIAGATSNILTVTGGISNPTDYQLVVTCTYGNLISYSNTVSLGLNSWVNCYCVPTVTVQDELITNTTIGSFSNSSTGFGVSGYEDFTNLTPIALSAGLSYSFSASISPFYGSDVVAVWIDMDHDGTFANPGERLFMNAPSASPASGTITIPASSLGGVTRMRVRLDYANSNPAPCGNTSYGNTEDYMVNITPAVPCTGTPTAGVAYTAATAVCPGVSISMTDTGSTVGFGIIQNWEKYNATSGAWDSVGGATSNIYTLAAGITAPAQYRFRVTCSFSGVTSYSDTLSFTMANLTNCYCSSHATSTADEELLNVTVGNLNNTSTCGVLAPGPGSIPYEYSNYTTSVPAVSLVQGFATNVSIKIGYCNTGAYNNVAAIYIDYNQNGSFTDAGEQVYLSSYGVGTVANGRTVTGAFTIPTTATLGVTRMRVIAVESTVANPCGTYTWGETEDYNVNIVPPCSGTPNTPVASAAASSGCAGGTVALSATGASSSPDYGQQWGYSAVSGGPYTNISGATTINYTATLPTTPGTYYYVLTSTCTNSGLSATSNEAVVVVNALPTITVTPSYGGNFCGNGTLTASGAATYVWSPANLLQSNTGATVTSIATANTTFSVVGTDANGCSNSATQAITYSAPPAISVSATTPSFCVGNGGGTTTLSATSTMNYAYTFTALDGAVLSNTTANTVDAAVTQTSAILVTGTDATSGCIGTQVYSVGVYPYPTATLSTTATGVCPGTPATINSGLSSGNFSTACITAPTALTTPPQGAVTLANAGAATTALTNGTLDDGYWNARPIGFTFNYFGHNYNTLNISTNGVLDFTATGTGQYAFSGFPNTLSPANTIAACARDLNLTSAGSIKTWNEGYAPNRRFVVQYSNVPTFNYGGTPGAQSIEVVLYETLGNVEIRAISATNGTQTNTLATTKSIGLQDTTKTIGATSPDCTTGTANYWNNVADEITTPLAWRFSPPANYTTTWYANGTQIANGTNVFSQSVAPTATTTYSITYTNQITGCTNAAGSAQVTMQILGTVAPSGVNTVANVPSVCPNGTVNLSMDYTGSTAGLTYQWQYSTDGGNTWTNISGATNATASATQTVATLYQCVIISCGGTADYSAPAFVDMSLWYDCYCASAATTTFDEDISQVIFGSLNNSSTCGQVGTYFTSVASKYSSYTTLTPTNVSLAQVVPFTVKVKYCGTNNTSNKVAIFIDYNHNGVFDANENAYTSTYAAGTVVAGRTITGNITIPTTATMGVTAMRVIVLGSAGSGTAVNPCGTYSYGETEDYLINILCATPTVSIAASSSSICSGSTVNFTANGVNGGTAATYQWMLNGVAISGETNSTYSSSMLSNGDVVSASYTSSCGNAGTASSNNVTMTVNAIANPSVTVSTASSTACTGSSVTISANGVDGGSTPSYQWYLNSTAISGATGSSYTSSSFYDGDNIAVQMTTSAACYTNQTVNSSNSVTMSILPIANPTVSAVESVNNICAGTSVTFTATGNDGGSTPGYQWYVNGNAVSGETNSTYTSTMLNDQDAVTVVYTTSSPCYSSQSATSAPITMTVHPFVTPTISATTVSTSVCAGAQVQFTSSATNEGPSPSYQWYVNGNAISGATGVGYTANGVNDGDNYSVMLTSSALCASPMSPTSNAVTMSVYTPTANVVASGPLALCPGGHVTLTVDPATSYSWSNGATTQSIVVGAAGNYSVTTTSSLGCTAQSSVYTVISKAAPTAVTIATGSTLTTVCSPATVLFRNTNASTLYGFNYQWMVNGTPIAGATDTVYVAQYNPAIGAINGGSVTLTVSGSTCSKSSLGKPYQIKPRPVAEFTPLGPSTISICTGASITLSAPNKAGYTYKWLLNGASKGTTNPYLAKTSGVYTLIATLNLCNDTSLNPITLVVNPLPVISGLTAAPGTICAGQSSTLSATPSNGAFYWWYIGTAAVDSSASANRVVSPAVSSTYKVMMRDVNGCLSKAAGAAKVTITPLPVPSVAPATGTIATNGSVTLTAAPAAGVTFQWYTKVGNVLTPISGATAKTYVAHSAGTYVVGVTKTGCTGYAQSVLSPSGVREEPGTTNGSEMSFELSAYPNPVSDVLTVNVTGIEEVNGTVTVMDFNGRLVISKEMKASSMTVDMTGMASGVYLVRYKDGEGRTGTIKITKQ